MVGQYCSFVEDNLLPADNSITIYILPTYLLLDHFRLLTTHNFGANRIDFSVYFSKYVGIHTSLSISCIRVYI